MFRRESVYFQSVYDSEGYVFSQSLYLGTGGALILLTRTPDHPQVRSASIREDIRIREESADEEG